MGARPVQEAVPRRAALLVGGLLLLATARWVASPGLAATLPLASKPLTVYRTCTLTATPSTSTAEIDSSVDESNTTTNNGAAIMVDSQSHKNRNRRIYLRFDLTMCRASIPASATVTNALLRLYIMAIPGPCRTEDVFRVTAAWTETGITWNNQPFGTGIDNPPSGQRTDGITLGGAPCQNSATNVYATGWNVAPGVQAFVSGTATNYGWMIRDDAEDSGPSRLAQFSSKDANVLAQSPQLVVTYTS